MSNTMQLFPAAGRTVPDPERGDDLPTLGREVVRSPYWVRRLNAGDVIEVLPKVPKESKA